MQTTLFINSIRSLKCSPTLNASFTHYPRVGLRFKSSKAKPAAKAASKPPSPPTPPQNPPGPTNPASINPSSPTSPQHSKEKLSWPEYLTIRRSKRRWQNLAAVPCSIVGLMGGAAYFGSLDTDPMKPIFGIDPFMFYGICTAATMGAGYLVGPTVGAAIWRLLPYTKRYGSLIDQKDKEFYERISRNRVDVTLQTPTSPVPDYYGEKIGSLHDYRRWLRDQNKYRRKVVFEEAA